MVKPAGFAEVWEQIHALTADEDYSSLRNRLALRFRPKGRDVFSISLPRCGVDLCLRQIWGDSYVSKPKVGVGPLVRKTSKVTKQATQYCIDL